MKKATLLILAVSFFASLGLTQPLAPPPPNDWCSKAIPIKPGETLSGMDNISATKSMEFEAPAIMETTCVQSIENDLWFSFTTIPNAEYYEVTIAMAWCNTPAGLQAMVIQSEDCNASKFVYRACSNKINTDTIKLFVHAENPGLRHLIWVDGYDGNFCEFDISLKATGPLSPTDYRFLRFDYDLAPTPTDHLPTPSIAFQNNVAVIRWDANSLDPVALYLVEQLPDLENMPEAGRYAKVVGIVDPNTLVGNGETFYEFEDYISDYLSGTPLRYRIVQVMPDGSREASEILTVVPQVIESFFAEPVKPGKVQGEYTVRYLNHKKGQDLRLKVLDESGRAVKESLLANEPVRDGYITLQMQGFALGEYTFIMTNGKDTFKRRFRH